MTTTKEIVKASTHWYHKDGTPCYTVEYADKKRKGEFRPTTKRDAKKLDLVPSVTGILKVITKPGLEVWKQQQVLESAYTCPLKRSEVDSGTWLSKVMEDAQEQAKNAREKGNIKHAQVENYFKAQILPDDQVTCEQIQKINQLLMDYEISGIDDIEAEKSFACEKWGGKMDMPALKKNFIADLKTTEFTLVDGIPHKKGKKDKMVYPEHIQQLAGYGMGNGLKEPTGISIFLSTIDNSVWHYHWDLEDYLKACEQFMLMSDLWWSLNW